MKEKAWDDVLEAVRENKYTIKFSDGSIKQCASRSLRTQRGDSGIPLAELQIKGGESSNTSTVAKITGESIEADSGITTVETAVETIAGVGDENGYLHDGK